MERDKATITVDNVTWVEEGAEPVRPAITIDVANGGPAIRERLEADGTLLGADEVDVALRLQDSLAADTVGVLGVANRLTGEYILELNVSASTVVEFVRAARAYGETGADDEGEYEVALQLEGTPVVRYEKRTLLVYDEEGGLLRQHSLIPSGVEL